jgi:hypothetical protein
MADPVTAVNAEKRTSGLSPAVFSAPIPLQHMHTSTRPTSITRMCVRAPGFVEQMRRLMSCNLKSSSPLRPKLSALGGALNLRTVCAQLGSYLCLLWRHACTYACMRCQHVRSRRLLCHQPGSSTWCSAEAPHAHTPCNKSLLAKPWRTDQCSSVYVLV